MTKDIDEKVKKTEGSTIGIPSYFQTGSFFIKISNLYFSIFHSYLWFLPKF